MPHPLPPFQEGKKKKRGREKNGGNGKE